MKAISIVDKQDNNKTIIDELEKIQDFRIYSIDHDIHNSLKKNGIAHILGDDLLDENMRLKIHQESFNYLQWHKNISNKVFDFEGYNMLNLIDYNEFQILITEKLSRLFCVKKILESEKPDKIFTTHSIIKILKSIGFDGELVLISEIQKEEKLFFDTIEIKFNSRILPNNIKLSRKNYLWIKNCIEGLISVIYGLKFEKNENKSVLLIEFNPEMYEKLFYEIKNLGMEVVLINSRRSSVWSKKSISILKKTQAKIITLSDFLEKKDNKTIIKKSEFLREEFLKIFENENSLKQIFSINGISFWEIIKKQVISMYLSRIVERLSYVLIAKKLFNEKKFSSILSLNLSGESEKVFTNSKYTSIMLQHAFGNYSKEIKSLEMTDDLNLIKGKIAVWGDVIKNYLLDNYNISEENIIVSGSPRHDLFFGEQKVNDNELILLTPRPIINDIVGEDTKKYELYEETIKRIITAVENSKSKLVVKLHPQKNQHNNDIKDMIQKINPEIEIYQDVSILELLKKCKLMINLSPDNYDASTTILEAMIMKKPVIDVTLEKKRFGFEFLKDKAIETLDFESDIENLIFEIITNQNKHKDLIKNSQIHLRKYLANQGNASKILAENL